MPFRAEEREAWARDSAGREEIRRATRKPRSTPGSLRVCHTEFVSRRSSISFLPSSGFSYLDSFRQARGRVKGSFCVFWFLINSLKATPHPGENTVVWGGEISTPTQNTFKGPVQHVTYEVRTGFQQKIFSLQRTGCYVIYVGSMVVAEIILVPVSSLVNKTLGNYVTRSHRHVR